MAREAGGPYLEDLTATVVAYSDEGLSDAVAGAITELERVVSRRSIVFGPVWIEARQLPEGERGSGRYQARATNRGPEELAKE